MSRYQFPVKMHRFTSTEFTKRKAAYVAKYGYTVNIPGFKDIIKLGLETPPTEKELSQYSSKDPGELSVKRWQEIKAIKLRKKESFLRMMQSPSSTWASNVATAMTFLDDVNDTLGTLSMVCRLAAHMLPKCLGKILMGPAGWALTAAEIANVGMTLSRLPMKAVNLKANLHKGLGLNPFNKKARVSRAAKLRTIRPSKGEIIEALQTTDNICGVGLCLGPIMGLATDLIFGAFRVATGKSVKINMPWAGLATHEQLGLNVFKAVQQLWTGGPELTHEDKTKTMLVANMATQMAYPIMQDWHPVDNISDINNIELQAPWPTDPTTLETLLEAGYSQRQAIGFLSWDKQFATPMDLWDSAEPMIDDSFHNYCDANKHNQQGLMTAQTTVETIQNMYSLMEGEDHVMLGYSETEKAIHKMFDNGWRFDPENTPRTLQCFSVMVEQWADQGYDFAWQDLQPLLEQTCACTFTRKIPTW
ncbi:hypothetical protein ES702_06238 [subsurface metagenome]